MTWRTQARAEPTLIRKPAAIRASVPCSRGTRAARTRHDGAGGHHPQRDPVHRLRRILLRSTAVAAGQRQAREKRLARAQEEMDKLASAAGGRHYKTREKIAARAGVIAAKRRVSACLRFSITTDEDGTPALAWHFDQGALDAEAAVDGW
ncbi:hypothetical protein [Streptomyces sp. NPDC057910]|uniref:hypothetical protein n=1 Tax=Streptomyces sp. NPDC057910 TaxID=3346278 RepID=UPI0036EC17D4